MNHTSDRGSIKKKHRELKNCDREKQRQQNPVKKYINRHSSKDKYK